MLIRIDLLESDNYRMIETSSIYSFALFLKDSIVEVETRHGQKFEFKFKLPRYAILFYIFLFSKQDFENCCFSKIIEELNIEEQIQQYKLEHLTEGL